jgi:hypothetical protein
LKLQFGLAAPTEISTKLKEMKGRADVIAGENASPLPP